MKKSIMIVALLLAGSALMAQGGPGGPRRTVEERVQMIHSKMDSAFKPGAAKLAQIDSVFAGYYRASDKMRDDAQGDFQGLREKMQPLTDGRDEKLKPILGEANYKTWKETIEPSMRPQRPRN